MARSRTAFGSRHRGAALGLQHPLKNSRPNLSLRPCGRLWRQILRISPRVAKMRAGDPSSSSCATMRAAMRLAAIARAMSMLARERMPREKSRRASSARRACRGFIAPCAMPTMTRAANAMRADLRENFSRCRGAARRARDAEMSRAPLVCRCMRCRCIIARRSLGAVHRSHARAMRKPRKIRVSSRIGACGDAARWQGGAREFAAPRVAVGDAFSDAERNGRRRESGWAARRFSIPPRGRAGAAAAPKY